MPDRAKVIKGLECCVKGNACNRCDYKATGITCVMNLEYDVLDLLKEQDEIINKLNGFINGFSKNAVLVVRCKDCKHYNGVNFGCGALNLYPKPDWFCADGEQQEGR